MGPNSPGVGTVGVARLSPRGASNASRDEGFKGSWTSKKGRGHRRRRLHAPARAQLRAPRHFVEPAAKTAKTASNCGGRPQQNMRIDRSVRVGGATAGDHLPADDVFLRHAASPAWIHGGTWLRGMFGRLRSKVVGRKRRAIVSQFCPGLGWVWPEFCQLRPAWTESPKCGRC